MESFTDTIKKWWCELEARSLANLPPDQREDVMAFDRHLRGHKWRYTGIVLAVWVVAAVCFRMFAKNATWLESFVLMFLLFGSTGFAMMSVWFGHAKFKGSWRTAAIATALAVAGALFGAMVGRYVKSGSLDGMFDDPSGLGGRVLLGGFIAGVVYSILLLAVLQLRRRSLQARNDDLRRQAESERIARQLADARLRLMQAQVEPHFLFNTLASVQQLAEGRAPEAASLTRELITFLRRGLSGLRDDTTTLAREFEMAAAYLAIMKTRMGDRLTFSMALPDDLADKKIPPAMLISLVENAIKHGLEPSTEGGSIAISASVGSDHLLLEVVDTGLGLGQSHSVEGGVGLANVRERLAAIYGDHAQLLITENTPIGVIAAIRFPIQTADTERTDAGEQFDQSTDCR